MAVDTRAKTNGVDRSKSYVCRAGCGFETTWPAALGRHEQARHGSPSAQIAVIWSKKTGNGTRAAKGTVRRGPMGKGDGLFKEIRDQRDELLQVLKKAHLLVLADRDERTREAGRVKPDLDAVYEVLERNRRDREQRISALIR